ncbi:MAG: orotidine 5'-phosphate decarboxylase / HUMPS family protein [Desulfurococcaceae archaeon]
MKPILQIALDLTDLFKAIEIATSIVKNFGCSNIWIEAGTPLLKSWGKIVVKSLKELTNCFIVADTKTMDTGGLEAEIFYKAGADAVTVLGVSDNETILDALSKAREYGRRVIVDLINHPAPYERAIELSNMNIDVILYHIGVDVQRKRGLTAIDLIQELKSIKDKVSCKLAVAGGIKHGDARKLVDIGVDIIIVGGAIVKSDNPVESTRKFLEEILY